MATEASGRPPADIDAVAPIPTAWNAVAEAGAARTMEGGDGTGVGVGVGVGVGAPIGPPPPASRVSVEIQLADLLGTDLVWAQR